ncbi:hypothetical protein GGR55DRAFT_628904 [Xylaria sp. FL0064]|nr:hypothetical protein GGR55DRAFT_628904 [Xylaria sp. FL0064]
MFRIRAIEIYRVFKSTKKSSFFCSAPSPRSRRATVLLNGVLTPPAHRKGETKGNRNRRAPRICSSLLRSMPPAPRTIVPISPGRSTFSKTVLRNTTSKAPYHMNSRDVMPATIECLPVELIAHIATYLEFQPVCSLRLASRTLAGKLSPAYLPQFFAYKNVKFDHESLNEFVYMTYPGRAGCVLRHCTITVVEESRLVLTRLLNDAFTNLKQNSPRAGLVSLRVNAESLPKGTFYHLALEMLWRTAQQTFETTMTALRKCHLPVSEHLELRGSVQGCSLSYRDALFRITDLASATTVFGLLKKLTMSLSSMCITSVQIPSAYDRSMYGTAHVRQSVHGSSVIQGLLVMLASMPHLEELHIHSYNVGSLFSSLVEEGIMNLDNMNLDVTAPLDPAHLNLKACSLRGLYVAEEDLLRYLKAVRPTKLILADIRLIPRTWTPIFECLSSSTLPITYYHLDDLREGDGLLVHFDDVPGQSKFPYCGVQMGPSTLTRQMDEVGATIRYRCTTRWPLGSGERKRWLESKTLEFGPPLNFH